MSVPLKTAEIRDEVLSSSPSNQEQIIKGYIGQVLEVLNTIESNIDQVSLSKIGHDPLRFDIFAMTKQRL